MTGAEADRERLSLARKLGADHCLVVGKDNLKETIDGLTGGLGVHCAFECSGVGAAFQDCLELVRKMGRVIQVGLYGKPAQIDMDLMTFKRLPFAVPLRITMKPGTRPLNCSVKAKWI